MTDNMKVYRKKDVLICDDKMINALQQAAKIKCGRTII